jgi:hypothetical protein
LVGRREEGMILEISMGHQSTTYRGMQSLNWVIDRHIVLIYLYISLISHTCIYISKLTEYSFKYWFGW